MIRNNLWSLAGHAVILALIEYGRRWAWQEAAHVSDRLLWVYAAGAALSFLTGAALRKQRGPVRILGSSASLVIAAILALPAYLYSETLRHYLYFTYIFHMPMPIVERLAPGLPAAHLFAASLAPYALCTLGLAAKSAWSARERKRGRAPFALSLLLAASAALNGCALGRADDNAGIAAYMKPPPKETEYAETYALNILFLHGDQSIRNRAALQHLHQLLYAGLHVTAMPARQFASGGDEFSLYDLIFLDERLDDHPEWESIRAAIEQFVLQGGTVYLQHSYAHAFPHEFLGIEGMVPVTDSELSFEYPDIGANLRGLQTVWKIFTDIYGQYRGLDTKHHIRFEEAAKVSSALPVVTKGGLAYVFARRQGDGLVIWSNRFLPSEQFITSLDLIGEEGQKYFHMGWTTANLLFRSELVNTVSKKKYGFSVKKAYGAYGRPALAWQAHYEALYSYVLRDAIKFAELLRSYDQVPTYSLVRGVYDGGKWNEAVRIHENAGTNAEPAFIGMQEHSFFSSGRLAATADDFLRFASYPGYHTFLSPIELPYRAYLALAGENLQPRYDLIAGSADGTVYGLRKSPSPDAPDRVEREPLKTADGSGRFAERFAAPAVIDWNGDGRFDLVVGDGGGNLQLYIQDESGRFRSGGPLAADGAPVRFIGPASPHVADWDGDGTCDLIVGDGSGGVHWLKGAAGAGGYEFFAPVRLPITFPQEPPARNAAPFAVDWNGDGLNDLLLGGADGEIRVVLQNERGELADAGKLTGMRTNFFGTETIKVGHHSVPVVFDWNGDGIFDVLTGHLEYGNTYPMDSGHFPYRSELKHLIEYVQSRSLPLIPHMYLHEYMSKEQEKREMELHRQAFRHWGIPWDDDMGVNHHTWRINRHPLQTFENQRSVGIWWNFGFNPPGVSSAPRDGREFLLVHPFLLPEQNRLPAEPFVLFAPAPHPLNFPAAWEALARFDIPLTMFEHIEHGLKPFTAEYEKLMKEIRFMDEFRHKHNYTFMTEDQIARSLLNTFYGKVEVRVEGNKLSLRPDMSKVPAQVKEYAGTLGVKVEPGEAFETLRLNTSSHFSFAGNGGYYIGLPEGVTTAEFSERSTEENYIRIIGTNSPVAMHVEDGALHVVLSAKGMQELKIYSPAPLAIKGEGTAVRKEGQVYRIVHFGGPASLTIQVK